MGKVLLQVGNIKSIRITCTNLLLLGFSRTEASGYIHYLAFGHEVHYWTQYLTQYFQQLTVGVDGQREASAAARASHLVLRNNYMRTRTKY